MTLDNKDIDMLLEGLRELEQADAKTNAMATMVGVMLSKDKEHAQRLVKKSEAEIDSMRGDQKELSERILVLKAKLVQMRPPAFEPEKVKA